jgi:hypothetical protein
MTSYPEIRRRLAVQILPAAGQTENPPAYIASEVVTMHRPDVLETDLALGQNDLPNIPLPLQPLQGTVQGRQSQSGNRHPYPVQQFRNTQGIHGLLQGLFDRTALFCSPLHGKKVTNRTLKTKPQLFGCQEQII